MAKKKLATSTKTVKTPTQLDTVPQERPKKKSRIIILLLVLAIVVGLAWRNKQYIVSAVVNGKPITRWELTNVLVQRYGEQTLDNLITKNLVETEISKQNIEVSQAQVDEKVSEIEKTVPTGMTLDQALKLQGTTLGEFRDQIKLQLAVSQLLEKQIQISDADIDAYLKENEQFLTATTAAAKREEAREALKNQRLSEEIEKWVNDLRSKAKISKYL